jgi:hypothetical protein
MASSSARWTSLAGAELQALVELQRFVNMGQTNAVLDTPLFYL